MNLRLLLLALAALGFSPLALLRAQSPSPLPSATAADSSAPEDAGQQRVWAQQQLDRARSQEAALDEKSLQTALASAGLPDSSADFLASAHETTRNYQTALDLLTSVINNQRVLSDLKDQPPLALPKSPAESDTLRKKISALRSQSETLATQLRLDDTALIDRRTALETAGQAFTRASEDMEAATDAKTRQKASLLLQAADLRQQAAASAVFIARWRITLDEIDQQINALNLQAQQKALADSGLDTVFNADRAQARLDEARRSSDNTRKRIDEVRPLTASLNKSLADITEKLDKARAEGRPVEAALLAARQTVVREAADAAGRIVQTDEELLAGLTKAESLWLHVLETIQKPSLANYLQAREKAEKTRANLEPLKEQVPRSLQDIQHRLDELQNSPLSRDADSRKFEQSLRDLLARRADQLREISTRIEDQFSLTRQMVEESAANIAERSFSERGAQAVRQAALGVRALWDQQLFAPDKRHPITLGKLLIAIVGVLAGLALVRLLTRSISANIRTRFSVDPQRLETLDKAIAFSLFCVVILSALSWLNIPLTAFAFLGGALAIGVGFGAQALMNNFISGLILIAERRIKVGDIIEVDSYTGTVMNLGTRCSRISRPDGVEVLVPNSYLLEKNVVNWTLSNPTHRFDFTIGLGYDTDPARAIALLTGAVAVEDKVLKDPAPQVFFESFGDSALVFHIYYWVSMRGTDNRVVGSNIRTRIATVCRENNISIPFPQSEVRVFTSSPLDIRSAPPSKNP